MDAKFLGDNYAWGSGTYHTFVAAHEFGHLLGFRHEQDRSDSSCHVSQDFSGVGIPLTGYDPDSIMNYCDAQRTQLTNLDRQGFVRAYSFLGGAPLIAPNGKCLDVKDASTADRTNIQLYTCNGTGAQSFRIDALDGGAFRIVNTLSNKCVDVSDAGTADGTNIQLYTCNGTGAQSFWLQDAGGGYSSLVNTNSGKCVDIALGGTQDGTKIQLYNCNGTDAQRWRVAK
jgi:hypothetical protein